MSDAFGSTGDARPGQTILVGHGWRPIVAGAALLAALAAAVSLFAARVANIPEEPGAVDIAVLVVLIGLVVFLALCLPLVLSAVRRGRFRIAVDGRGLTLRDGRTVAWSEVARIDADPVSPSLLRLWLLERATPRSNQAQPLVQPNPVAVSLRGLDVSPDRARAVIEGRWRQSREPAF